MKEAEFRLLERIEEDHWWFVGKRLILRALLDGQPVGARLLDLGCGTGGILRDWTDRGACVGMDGSPLALRICKRRGFSVLARGDLERLPFRDGAFDTIVLMDVLEHLDDDRGLLRGAARLCAPGGRVVVSVPAFQLLWSRHDETFGHRRRYRARQLEAIFDAAGLERERTTYTNFLVFPVALVWRVLSRVLRLGRSGPGHDFWPVPGWLNALLVRAYRLEAWWLARADLPVGVSVVCIGRKPAA